MNNRFAFLPMAVANDLLDEPEALRSQLDRDGYLYFEQLIDRRTVNTVRRDVLRTLAKLGWVEKGEAVMGERCLIAPLREEDEAYIAGYQEVQRLESFHSLAHDPTLLSTMRSVLGGSSAFPHPLKIARLAFPDHYEASTPPHQDFPNNQGTPRLTATWIPLGDIAAEAGGLALLSGSHRYGPLPMEGHIGAGNRCAVISPEMAERCRWVTTEFHQGDVLVFPSLTVHASLHNASEFFMRLSVDFRYQLEGEPLTPGCLKPHFQRLSWDEIYRDWQSTEHQYYWRDLDFEEVPFETIPVVGASGSTELGPKDVAEILDYQARVDARVERRMRALGRTGGSERDH